MGEPTQSADSGAGNGTDGRRLRGERTRTEVEQALLALLDEGVASPTTEQIAARAGVAKRTVFHHYPDRRALLAAAVSRREAPLVATLELDPEEVGLEQRIKHFVAARAKTLALLTPLQRAVRAVALEAPEVKQRLSAAEAELAIEVRRVFAPELDRLVPEQRRATAAALVAASAWTAWENYRLEQQLGADQARAAMRAAIAALVREP